MPYVVEYRHGRDEDTRTAEVETAAGAVKLCEHLADSDSEVIVIRLDREHVSLGELKNEAGREATKAGQS